MNCNSRAFILSLYCCWRFSLFRGCEILTHLLLSTHHCCATYPTTHPPQQFNKCLWTCFKTPASASAPTLTVAETANPPPRPPPMVHKSLPSRTNKPNHCCVNAMAKLPRWKRRSLDYGIRFQPWVRNRHWIVGNARERRDWLRMGILCGLARANVVPRDVRWVVPFYFVVGISDCLLRVLLFVMVMVLSIITHL